MFSIVKADFLTSETKRFIIAAPRVARKQRPGQFVIVRINEHGERIPLTIADADPEPGTITLIVQGIGKTTMLMNTLQSGDALIDVVGPLGKPSEVKNYGTVVVVGGGVGTAIAFPTARAMKEAGNHVIAIVGARTRELLILEHEIGAVADRTIITTDDGSYGHHGLVTDPLGDLIESGIAIDFILAIGPIPMMRAVAETSRPHRIKTVVSLNSIMVDGTGMCGGCRVLIGGKSQFACVDGPEFNAHEVDFDILARRNTQYRDAEQRSLADFLQQQQQKQSVTEQVECALEAKHPEVVATKST